MSVNLRVGPIAYPVALAALYRDGELSPDAGDLARSELVEVERELRRHPPVDVVWDIDRPGVLPPWGNDIADTITSLGNYFVTADGRQLIAVMDAALEACARTRKVARIA